MIVLAYRNEELPFLQYSTNRSLEGLRDFAAGCPRTTFHFNGRGGERSCFPLQPFHFPSFLFASAAAAAHRAKL